MAIRIPIMYYLQEEDDGAVTPLKIIYPDNTIVDAEDGIIDLSHCEDFIGNQIMMFKFRENAATIRQSFILADYGVDEDGIGVITMDPISNPFLN